MSAKQRHLRVQALEGVKALLRFMGEDPDREGLRDTPERVIRAWEMDWGKGYNKNYMRKEINSILKGRFDKESYSQMIVVKKINFSSHCEHHLAPFYGTCRIGYIPSKEGKMLGLSKPVRIVNMFSRRLQVQERLTEQIADFIDKNCNPVAVGVLIKATHGCMLTRGVKQHESEAVTAALRGEMLTRPEVRDEFYRMVGVI